MTTYESWESFIKQKKDAHLYFVSTKGNSYYHNITYPENSYFIFGPETRGIPEDILRQFQEKTIKIPMISNARSLNLANSVAIVIYEALRQTDFKSILSN